jgi:hypothetical protein
MRQITWLRPDGKTYVSPTQASQSDVAIPDTPGADFSFNRERWEWERVYEAPAPNDITVPEAEELWRLAHEENNAMASVLLKHLNL